MVLKDSIICLENLIFYNVNTFTARFINFYKIIYLFNITNKMVDFIYGILFFIHNHILFLNNSKFFAGIVMILLNIGSKFITVQFSKSTEEYLKMNITKQILIFAMSWMATRDIYTALVLTAVFTILSDHLFNEESPYCIVPDKYRVLTKVIDNNDDGIVSEKEIIDAIAILEKAKKEKTKQQQRQTFTMYGNYIQNAINTTV
jgi:hypothetical protein